MSDPVGYQPALPVGSRLRICELPDGLRVTRESVSRFALWREALVPALCAIVLIGAALFAARAIGRNVMDREWLLAARIGIFGVAAALLAWIIREARQNAGIVTDVAVTRAVLYWRKLNLWGPREYFWPLNTIVQVCYDPTNHSLRVHRVKAASLNAFAYISKVELQHAATLLHSAVARNRSAGAPMH